MMACWLWQAWRLLDGRMVEAGRRTGGSTALPASGVRARSSSAICRDRSGSQASTVTGCCWTMSGPAAAHVGGEGVEVGLAGQGLLEQLVELAARHLDCAELQEVARDECASSMLNRRKSDGREMDQRDLAGVALGENMHSPKKAPFSCTP